MDGKWKQLFDVTIRNRGKDLAGYAVDDYTADENGYFATVCGSEIYEVTIAADYSAMHCTCPYASEGKRCKHMAAVLYYAEWLERRKKEEARRAAEREKRRELRAAIAEAQEKHGINLQLGLLQEMQTIPEWGKGVNNLIKCYQNKDGSVGYREADCFIGELLKYFETLYSYVSLCPDKKAIDASVWLYKRIHDVGIDDSSTGCMGYFEDETLSFWEEVAGYSDRNREMLKTALTKAEQHYPAGEEMLSRLTKE